MPSSCASPLRDLYIANSFEQLTDKYCGTDTFDTKRLNDLATCNSILKAYDEAQLVLDTDHEKAYILLCRFVDLSLKIRKTSLYKTDKVIVDDLLSVKKINTSMGQLEGLKASLVKRYSQQATETSNVIAESQHASTADVMKANVSVDIVKKLFINPTDLIGLMANKDLRLLIVDMRTASDFARQHMIFDYVAGYDRDRVDYVNLDADQLIDINTTVMWKLEEKIKQMQLIELTGYIGRRASYDLVVLMDLNSRQETIKSDTKLVVFKRALYEFESKLKHEPIVLNGGWMEWIAYYPASKTTTTAILDENPNQTSSSLVNKTILNIQYPTIDMANMNETADDRAVSQSPIVDRSVKPMLVKNAESLNAVTVATGRLNIDDLTDNTTVTFTKKTFKDAKLNIDANNEHGTSTIPFQPLSHFIGKIRQPNTTVRNESKLDAPYPVDIVTDSRLQEAFNRIYKPINVPLMRNNGIIKFINPVTGLSSFVYDNKTNVKYMLDENLPDNLIAKPSSKDRADQVVGKTENKLPSPSTTAAPTTTPMDNRQISRLKRNMSSPNLLNDDTTNSPTSEPVKSAAIKQQPIVNRSAKPISIRKVVNVKRSRIEELHPVWSTTIHLGCTGLRNLGNTCFMNAVVQCLSNTPKLKDYFLNDSYQTDLNVDNPLGFGGLVASEFSLLVYAIWQGKFKQISPICFKSTIGKYNEQFLNNDQQDAQEFLLFLLDGLHEDLNRITQRPHNLPEISDSDDDYKTSSLSWMNHLKLNNSIIVDLFHGQFKSTVQCLTCNKKSVKFEPFMYLTIPIQLKKSKCTLFDCIELFLQPETMCGESKWMCPNCKQKRDARKKIDIWHLPRLLIIHLKRFKYDGSWGDKISTFVDYPINNLNLSAYLLDQKHTGNANYNLYGTCNHTGTLNGGHYTAACRNSLDEQWYKYDDCSVKDIDKDTIKSTSAYILFYSEFG